MNTVALIFRKAATGGHFSIERSFGALRETLNGQPDVQIRWVTACRRSKGLWPRLRILFQIARLKSDVFHITGDIHFAALATPKKRTILTVHDCGFLQHPNPVARWILWLFWLKLPVSRARVVTAVSETTKSEIVRYTGCHPEKIRVVPSTIPAGFLPCPRPFNSEKPRILHVGGAPNKNLRKHIEALQGIPCVLHIAAALKPTEIRLLERLKIEYDCTPNLSDAALIQAYERCDLLLFASTLEGFGMPILEAQSVGRPVVTSHCSSMPEVAGDAACFVDPFDPDSIRDGVQRILKDQTYREMLVARGFQNIRRFQAESSAREYLRLYRQILQSA